VPLGDNVQRISDHPATARRRRVSEARSDQPAPFDNLIELAVEIEAREVAPRPAAHLAPVPATVEPGPSPADVAAVAAPAPSIAKERLLLAAAGTLVVAIAILLLWGTSIERLFRPDLGNDRSTTELRAESPPDGETPAPASDDQSGSSTITSPPDPSTTVPPAGGVVAPPAQDPVVADPAPTAVSCDATSVWPAIAALNDIAPISVAWVTCLERYATAGLVPADAAPETPPSLVAALRDDAGTWTLVAIGEPGACASASAAADPAFPVSLCP
jgi:hypothetical protein